MKKTIMLVLFIFLGLTFATPLYAQSVKEDIQENREERQENIEKSIDTRCEIITNRVDTLTGRYEQNRLRYLNRYNKLIEYLNELVEVLNNKGVDTLDLPTQIDELEVQVDKFNKQVKVAIDTLNGSKNIACGESQGEYRSKVAQARAEMREARAIATGINNYISNTIIPELEEIKEVDET